LLRRCPLPLLFATIGTCSFSGAALASGFSVARFGGEHGHPVTDNPTALFHNPAALRAERPELFFDGLVGRRRITYTRSRSANDAPDAEGAEGANVGRATLDNWLVGPSLWLAVPVSSRLVLAAGLFTPFGGPVSWDERSDFQDAAYPGPVDGVTRFHSIEGISITSYGSLGGSYQVGDTGLRLGAAFNLMYSMVEDVRAWSSGGNQVAGEGRSLLEASGFAAGFAAGAFWESRAKDFRLGLSYQSRPNLAGGQRLHGELSNNIGGPSSANVELHQDLPDSVRLGIAYQVDPTIELRAMGVWERWSAFARQCVADAGTECQLLPNGGQPEGGKVLQNVPRDFHDAFEGRVGASVWLGPSMEVFSGIGVMSRATPDATLDPSLPDFFGVSFTLGARHSFTKSVALAASYTQIIAAPRDARSELASYDLPSKLPDASGHYTQSVGFADVNVSVRF
jgi:long-chain fatty acid transport protein